MPTLTEADLAAIEQRIFLRGATQHDCQRLRDALKASREREQRLRGALTGMVDMYAELINSGDAGFWNPEEVPEVIAARAALDGGGEGDRQ